MSGITNLRNSTCTRTGQNLHNNWTLTRHRDPIFGPWINCEIIKYENSVGISGACKRTSRCGLRYNDRLQTEIAAIANPINLSCDIRNWWAISIQRIATDKSSSFHIWHWHKRNTKHKTLGNNCIVFTVINAWAIDSLWWTPWFVVCACVCIVHAAGQTHSNTRTIYDGLENLWSFPLFTECLAGHCFGHSSWHGRQLHTLLTIFTFSISFLFHFRFVLFLSRTRDEWKLSMTFHFIYSCCRCKTMWAEQVVRLRVALRSTSECEMSIAKVLLHIIFDVFPFNFRYRNESTHARTHTTHWRCAIRMHDRMYAKHTTAFDVSRLGMWVYFSRKLPNRT